MVYLDNAATTFPKHESVYREMDRVNRGLAVNAGRGSYKAAKEASNLILTAKAKIKGLFHATGNDDVVFTPSVTHAVNQVLRGIKIDAETVIYLTPYEHNAVARTVSAIQTETGCRVEFLPLNEDFTIDTAQMEYDFSVVPPNLVIMNAVSNVTGYVLPIADICKAAKEYSSVTIIDAAQASGLIDLQMDQLDADIICFAGHKTIGGPFGIGGFLIKKNAEKYVSPSFTGGTGSNSLNTSMPSTAPEMYEASSPNIIAIAGLNAALLHLNVQEHYEIVRHLTDYCVARLRELPSVRILGLTDNAIGIISFVVEGYSSEDIGAILDEEFDIAVRTGYHCAPYIHSFLHDQPYSGTVRVGLGRYNTEEDIDILISALMTL